MYSLDIQSIMVHFPMLYIKCLFPSQKINQGDLYSPNMPHHKHTSTLNAAPYEIKEQTTQPKQHN